MPSGSSSRQRNKQCLVRLTDEEFAQITGKADSAGVATAAFFRAAALGDPGPRAQRRPPADHRALRRILGELGRIGNNINQIARRLNASESVQLPELSESLAAYLALRDAIFGALGMKPASPKSASKPAPPGHDHQGL